MSAGTGIRHSEFNHSKTEPVHFLQIWVIPDREGIAPRYEQKTFPEADKRSRLRLVGSIALAEYLAGVVIAVNGFFLVIDGIFFAANSVKLLEGGWFPLDRKSVV